MFLLLLACSLVVVAAACALLWLRRRCHCRARPLAAALPPCSPPWLRSHRHRRRDRIRPLVAILATPACCVCPQCHRFAHHPATTSTPCLLPSSRSHRCLRIVLQSTVCHQLHDRTSLHDHGAMVRTHALVSCTVTVLACAMAAHVMTVCSLASSFACMMMTCMLIACVPVSCAPLQMTCSHVCDAQVHPRRLLGACVVLAAVHAHVWCAFPLRTYMHRRQMVRML